MHGGSLKLKDGINVKRRIVYSKMLISWDDWSKFMVTFKYYVVLCI